MTFVKRRLTFDATLCIDVEVTLYERHVAAGFFRCLEKYVLRDCDLSCVNLKFNRLHLFQLAFSYA